MLFAEQLEFEPGVDLDIRHHSRKRDPDGLTMMQRNELERRDTPGVSLRRKRKRSELTDDEKFEIIEEYIERKRARRAVASKFQVSETLVTNLVQKY